MDSPNDAPLLTQGCDYEHLQNCGLSWNKDHTRGACEGEAMSAATLKEPCSWLMISCHALEGDSPYTILVTQHNDRGEGMTVWVVLALFLCGAGASCCTCADACGECAVFQKGYRFNDPSTGAGHGDGCPVRFTACVGTARWR